MSDIEYSSDSGVVTILLNRPERMNAFTLAMVDTWACLLDQAQSDDNVRAIVITGAGGAFCSGVDLSQFKGEKRTPLQEKDLLQRHVHRVALTLETVDKPVLAAIDGPAVGAGMDMALLCDLRFVSPASRFSEGYIRVGLVPGDGGCWLLPRVVGTSRALMLLWTGDFVGGQEAMRMGLADDLSDYPFLSAMSMAHRLANSPPVSIRMIKRAVRQGARHDLPTALDMISSQMAIISTTEDSAEAYSAFRDQRAGIFKGC